MSLGNIMLQLSGITIYGAHIASSCVIIIIIMIIIILGISFMQGTYTYIPEKNHVPREHCVATIPM